MQQAGTRMIVKKIPQYMCDRGNLYVSMTAVTK